MNDDDWLVKLVFTKEGDGANVSAAEVQLLLSFITDLLREIQEAEEKDIK